MPDDAKFPGWPRVGGGAMDPPAPDAGGEAPSPADGSDSGGEPAAVDLQQVAEDFEAQAIAELGGKAPAAGKEEGQGGEGPGETPADSDPIDTFVKQNYGGDKAAFVASLYEGRRESGRLASKIEELEAKLAGKPEHEPRDAEAELKAALEADADVQSLNQKIKGYDDRARAIGARQLEIANDAGKLDRLVSADEAELPHIEDQKEWSKKSTAVYRNRIALAGLQSEYQNNESRLERLSDSKDLASRELHRLERSIADRLADEEEQDRIETTDAVRTREQFAGAFEHIIKPFNLPANDERLAFLRESVRTQLADYLHSLGDEDGLDAAGIFNAVATLVAKGTKAFGLKPAAARPKVPPAPRPIVTPKPPALGPRTVSAPRNSDDVLSNPDLVRKRASAVFSALQKRGGARSPS